MGQGFASLWKRERSGDSGSGERFCSPAAVANISTTVSLARASALASNPIVASSRYHPLGSSRGLLDDYELVDGGRVILGSGLCGDVVLVRGLTDGRRYALKKIQKWKVPKAMRRQYAAEVEICLGLDHPNLVRLRDAYECQDEVQLVSECCDGGELYGALQRRSRYVEADAAAVTRQMLRAVAYLHSRGVAHRDLKLENFLFERKDEGGYLKLIDFGLAKIWDASTKMTAACGSNMYVSPDVLNGQGYTNKCDIWSVGVIVFMLLSGYPPFHGEEKEVRVRILAGEADWSHRGRWNPVSDCAQDFVRRLLATNPEQRPSARMALGHPWLLRENSMQARDVPAPSLGSDALRSMQNYMAGPKLRRMILQLLAQEMQPEDESHLRELFLNLDRNNEGTIRLTDLAEAVECSLRKTKPFGTGVCPTCLRGPASAASTCLPCAPSGALDKVLATLDASGESQIGYLDFLAATSGAFLASRDAAIKAAFRRLDADCSGSVGVCDIRIVLAEQEVPSATVETGAAEAPSCPAQELLREATAAVCSKTPLEAVCDQAVEMTESLDLERFRQLILWEHAPPVPTPRATPIEAKEARPRRLLSIPTPLRRQSAKQRPQNIACARA